MSDNGEGNGGGNQVNDGGCNDTSGGGGILAYFGPLWSLSSLPLMCLSSSLSGLSDLMSSG